MARYGDSPSKPANGEHGQRRDAEPASTAPGVGKASLVQLSVNSSGALVQAKPGSSTMAAQLVPVQRRAESNAAAPPGGQPQVDELDRRLAEAGSALASGPPIQRHPEAKQREYVPFKVIVTRNMTGEEFKTAAALQVFGGALASSEWKHVKDAYTPADSPVELRVEISLLRRVRGVANRSKGIDTDANGEVSGADVRAQAFQAQATSDEKSAVLAEVDRRYHAASGTSPGTRIQSSEAGGKELWSAIRDEVLFQHQYIANLPDKVKGLIRVSLEGRELTPADYDQLFRVAKKIEALPPGAAADYASKITNTTSDLPTLEAAVDGYRAELAIREQDNVERTRVQNKLLGLEEVYKLYKRYVQATTAEQVSPGVTATKQLVKALGGQARPPMT